MKNLRDVGRKDGEYSEDVSLGFGDDQGDYDGVLLVDGEWFIIRNGWLTLVPHFTFFVRRK